MDVGGVNCPPVPDPCNLPHGTVLCWSDGARFVGGRHTLSVTITTGIDVIEIERIEATLARFGERFLHRIYTDAEIAYCRGRVQSLAGRFAAKEAVSKALGVGIRTLRWRDIEVLPDRRGKPHVHLHENAARIAAMQGLTHFDISITHSRTDAIVMVVAWGDREGST